MSIFSDYEYGAMSYEEFREECKRMDRQEKYEREHQFDDNEESEDEDDD